MDDKPARIYGVSHGNGNNGVSHTHADYYVRTDQPSGGVSSGFGYGQIRGARAGHLTGARNMDMQRAIAILGINRTQNGDLREMVKALGLMPFLNTDEDDERRLAAQYVLRRWPAYQAECSKARDLRFRRR